MAHQLRSEVNSFNCRPHQVVVARQELALKLAEVAMTWSALENSFALLYGLLMGSTEVAPGVNIDEAAIEIFETLEVMPKRIQLLRVLANRRLKQHGEVLKELDALIILIKAAAGRRNTLIHGYWCIANEYPDELILVSGTHRTRLAYGPSDFEKALGDIEIADTSITKIIRTIQALGAE